MDAAGSDWYNGAAELKTTPGHAFKAIWGQEQARGTESLTDQLRLAAIR